MGQDNKDLEDNIHKDMIAGIFAVDTISTLKPIGILIWAFVSQLYVKSQKVSSALSLKSSFLAFMGVWTLLVFVQVGLSLEFVNHIQEKGPDGFSRFV